MVAVSVIMPVFNAEKYLEKSLTAVCAQKLKDIEVICVNDCSTDGSLAVLQEYAKKDSRIKVINFPQNKGAAAARNAGIAAAKGKYVGFFDADDEINEVFFSALYENADDADVVKGADLHVKYTDGAEEVWPQNELIKQNKFNFWAQFTTAIYKRDFLNQNQICFPENWKVCEDITFILKVVFAMQKWAFAEDAIYFYMKRDNSLDSAVYDDNKLRSFSEYVNFVSDFVSKQNI